MHDQAMTCFRWLAAIVCGWVLAGGTALWAQTGAAAATAHVQAAADALLASYNRDTGLFDGTGWWNSANGITVLANASRALHSEKYNSIFANTFAAAPKKFPGFLNEFYDDEGWWALAWLDVYQLHHDARYLKTAQSIFADMSGGWSDTCGGGIWWKKNERYKNAIANELFLSVAVRLAEIAPAQERAQYLSWAQREGKWFLGSGMINSDGLVNDGLNSDCKNNGKETWTYNQGVLLTGFTGLSGLTDDNVGEQTAERIVGAVASRLADKQGVLHDACEPKCGDDGVQFKGILVRNLLAMRKTPAMPAATRLITASADSVWSHARTGDNRFSVVWSGPPTDDGTGSLISAMDALVAELTVAPKD